MESYEEILAQERAKDDSVVCTQRARVRAFIRTYTDTQSKLRDSLLALKRDLVGYGAKNSTVDSLIGAWIDAIKNDVVFIETLNRLADKEMEDG